MVVEHVAGHDHVGVGEREERQQRLGVVDDLPDHRAEVVVVAHLAGMALVAQRPPADDDRGELAEHHAEHRAQLGGVPGDQREADDQARDTVGDVHHREREPAALALEDAGLAAHHGHRHRRHADEAGHQEVVEPQDEVDDRGQHQQHQADGERRAVGDAQDDVLDLADVAGIGGDPPGRGGLEAELQHADHQQGGHQAGEGAVLARAEDAGGDHRVAVRRHVHEADRDRDRAAAEQPLRQRPPLLFTTRRSVSHRSPRWPGTQSVTQRLVNWSVTESRVRTDCGLPFGPSAVC